MGMFDYVNAPAIPCPYCESVIGEAWQTKDCDNMLETVEVDDTRLTWYYTACLSCGEWVEFRRTVVEYSDWNLVRRD